MTCAVFHPGACANRATCGAKIVRGTRAGSVCGRKSLDGGERCGLNGGAGTREGSRKRHKRGRQWGGRGKGNGKGLQSKGAGDRTAQGMRGKMIRRVMDETMAFSTDRTENCGQLCFQMESKYEAKVRWEEEDIWGILNVSQDLPENGEKIGPAQQERREARRKTTMTLPPVPFEMRSEYPELLYPQHVWATARFDYLVLLTQATRYLHTRRDTLRKDCRNMDYNCV